MPIPKLLTPFILCLIASLSSVEISAQTSQLHNQANLDYLSKMSEKVTLTAAEIKKVRETMLAINNEARLNPNYRKAQGCKTALQLPADLKPLVLNEDLNKLAQEQADYQASIRKVTHDNRNYRDFGARVDKYLKNHPKPEACAGAVSLADYPIGWMKSETHYRPTWNLDTYNGKSIPVNTVGYGVARNGEFWYFTAIWSFVENPAASQKAPTAGNPATASAGNPVSRANPPAVNPASVNPASANTATLKYQSRMKPGNKLMEGEKMVSSRGIFQLRGTDEGNFVIEEVKNGRVVYTFPLAGPINNPPSRSFLSYNPDGNICISSKQNKGYCATNGKDGVAPVILYKSDHAELTDNGQLVLVNSKGDLIWQTSQRVLPSN